MTEGTLRRTLPPALDEFLIEGPCRLHGKVAISGAKNAALPALAASLLTGETVTLANVPAVADIRTMGKLLAGMGVSVDRHPDGTVVLCASELSSTEASYDLVRTMRAAILVLGPLLTRFGEAWVSLPGGCAIGVRPVDLHLKAFEAMGARIAVEKGYIHAHISRVGPQAGRLKGATIAFPMPTVTGTENVMLAAVLARGITRIENAAREPEVEDLARLLTSMGASVEGAGSSTITIEGVESLCGTAEAHGIIPDRIEAGTYLAAAALTGGDVTALDARPEHLAAFLNALAETGASVTSTSEGVRVQGAEKPRAHDIVTAPHPGFPTDLQAQFMALSTQAEGTSRIVETIFENRYLHAIELARLGADITIDGATAIVRGPRRLEGAPVTASDLRASAALVLAGLRAEGETRVRRIYHLDRGYSGMAEKLNGLGARVKRVAG
ncbi:MAG: UDP-N-acetylglucosamine 1-carboxyvinyltransferase [Thermoanaerobaculia bacterium]|nr:UDP-N-acetylglucosamine 1-carboxyvinyltransferase [Thermoanaerobaculia bacterium]